MIGSELERALIWQCKVAKIPTPTLQHRFAPSRRFRFDLAWPEQKLAWEVDGGGFVQGRHSRGKGMESDAEKYSLATILGWRVGRCTGKQIDSGEAVEWIRQALA